MKINLSHVVVVLIVLLASYFLISASTNEIAFWGSLLLFSGSAGIGFYLLLKEKNHIGFIVIGCCVPILYHLIDTNTEAKQLNREIYTLLSKNDCEDLYKLDPQTDSALFLCSGKERPVAEIRKEIIKQKIKKMYD